MPPKRKGAGKPTNRKFKSTEFQYPDASIGQIIGIIDKPMGNCRFSFKSINNEEKQGTLTGKMKKTPPRVREKDYIIAEPLSNEEGQYMIIFRYSKDQVNILRKEGYLQSINVSNEEDGEDSTFAFDGETSEKKEQVVIDDNFLDNI